ncbi:hypothetical protein EMCRGX_G009333 [Ephydatia muelleri]
MDTKDKRHDPPIVQEATSDVPVDWITPDLENEEYEECVALPRIGGPMSDRSPVGPLTCDACHKMADKLYQADSKFWQCKKLHGNLCLGCWGNTSHCPKCGDQREMLLLLL